MLATVGVFRYITVGYDMRPQTGLKLHATLSLYTRGRVVKNIVPYRKSGESFPIIFLSRITIAMTVPSYSIVFDLLSLNAVSLELFDQSIYQEKLFFHCL